MEIIKHLRGAFMEIAKSNGMSSHRLIEKLGWHTTSFNRKFSNHTITVRDCMEISDAMELIFEIYLTDTQRGLFYRVSVDGFTIGNDLPNPVPPMKNTVQQNTNIGGVSMLKLMNMVESLMEQNKLLTNINRDLIKKFDATG